LCFVSICEVGSQSRGKHLDWGSSRSIYQAQPLLPCTSNGKLTEKTEPGESTEGAKELGTHETDEVDSPVKDLMAHEKTKLSDVDNIAVLCRIDYNALLPIVNDEGTMHPKCFFLYIAFACS
jgi:hypothetical protein